MRRTAIVMGLGLVMAWASAGTVSGESTPPARTAPRTPAAPVTAESEFNRGLRAQAAKDWPTAVAAYRKATEMRPAYAEAWNGLGYSLRNSGQYQASLAAYDEALRLRPNFPEALEYLGEAYVKLGRLDDARRVLDRLKPLDAGRAQELAEEIAKAR